MNRHFGLGWVLVMLVALTLLAPAPAAADCPDTTVTCNRVWPDQGKYPPSVKTTVGTCSDGWVSCNIRNCSHWENSLINACKKALNAEHGQVKWQDPGTGASGDIIF